MAGAVNIPLVHVSVLTGFCFYVVICLNTELGRQVPLVHVKLSQALNWVWGCVQAEVEGGGWAVGSVSFWLVDVHWSHFGSRCMGA